MNKTEKLLGFQAEKFVQNVNRRGGLTGTYMAAKVMLLQYYYKRVLTHLQWGGTTDGKVIQ